MKASVNSASGKESPTDTADACAASALAGAADFGAGRAGTVTPAILRGCGNAKPFLVFGAADGEPEFGALLGALAFEPVPEVGPPNTPNELVFAVCPQPPEPGRTGHTPAALGVGTRGAGMDGFAVCVVVSGGGTDGNGARIGGGGPAGGGGAATGAVLLPPLPRLGQALATGTPTPTAFGGGGPAGGGGVDILGGGTRTAGVNGAGIEVKLEARSKVGARSVVDVPDAALVASWKLCCLVP